MNFIVNLELENYDELLKELLFIVDTSTRSFILKKYSVLFLKSKNIWKDKEVLRCFLIGLKVKELELDTLEIIKLTIFYFENEELFSVFKVFLDRKNTESQLKICDILLFFIKNVNNKFEITETNMNIIYNLVMNYLLNDKIRRSAIKVLREYYVYFGISKICKELLPQLCGLLFKQERDEIFGIIYEIIGFLKENKTDIVEEGNIKKWYKKISSRFVSTTKVIKNDNEDISRAIKGMCVDENKKYENNEEGEWNNDF